MPSSRARLFCFSVAGKSRELSSGRPGDRSVREDCRRCFFFGRELKPSDMARSPSPQTTYIYGAPPPVLTIKTNATIARTSPTATRHLPITRRNRRIITPSCIQRTYGTILHNLFVQDVIPQNAGDYPHCWSASHDHQNVTTEIGSSCTLSG